MGAKDQLLQDSQLSGDSPEKTVCRTSAVKGWFKAASGHVGLYTALIVYTALGGAIFRELEYPNELARLEALERLVTQERAQLISALANRSHGRHYEDLLGHYEGAVQQAAQGGLLLPLSKGAEPASLAKWSYLQAIFFASTVLTTIGYGNVTPATMEGRLFCIMFALIGIPLTLSVMADLGALIASRLPSMPEARGLKGSLLSAFAATSILIIYIAVGSLLFISWEADWSFFDGFYFCFVTMTTIGFGDLVPSTPQYMLLCTLYILLGLSLTSTIIELVRQQYSRSWRHLQALAETLSQLASERDRNPADLQADLRRILTVVKTSKNADFEYAVRQLSQDMAKLNNKPKIVQIIVYETSL